MLKEGDMSTMDHKPDRYASTLMDQPCLVLAAKSSVCRLNIHTGEDGTVTKVTHG